MFCPLCLCKPWCAWALIRGRFSGLWHLALQMLLLEILIGTSGVRVLLERAFLPRQPLSGLIAWTNGSIHHFMIYYEKVNDISVSKGITCLICYIPPALCVCVSITGTWDAGSSTWTFHHPIHRPLLTITRYCKQGYKARACPRQLQPRHLTASFLYNHSWPYGWHHHFQWQPGKRNWIRTWYLRCSNKNGIQIGRHLDGRYPLSCWSDRPAPFICVSWGFQVK